MHNLRLLIALLAAGAWVPMAFAAMLTVQSGLDQKESPSNLNRNSQTTDRSYRTTLSYQADRLLAWQPTLSLEYAQVDYDNYLVMNERGEEVTLAQREGTQPEAVAQLSADYMRGDDQLVFGGSASLNDSAFKQQNINLSYDRFLNARMSRLGAGVSYSWLHEPASYYRRSLMDAYQARPELVHAYRAHLRATQIFTPTTKGALELFSGRRVEDRPQHFGARTQVALALSERWFARALLEHAFEDRSQSLQNERGYFSASEARIEFTVEPIYDLLLSAGYAFTLERENNVRTGSKVQLGADHYLAGLNYKARTMTYQLQSSYVDTNHRQESFSFLGGLQWEI